MYATALTFEKLLQVVTEVPVVREVLTHFPLPHSPHTFSSTPTLSVSVSDLSLPASLYKAEHLGFIYVLFCFLDFILFIYFCAKLSIWASFAHTHSHTNSMLIYADTAHHFYALFPSSLSGLQKHTLTKILYACTQPHCHALFPLWPEKHMKSKSGVFLQNKQMSQQPSSFQYPEIP